MRSSQSDYEIALSLSEVESFATGTGYYAGLPREIREEQLAMMARLTRSLYPRLRVTLFDARRLYSAPLTVFGPLLAALYLGRNYLAFRDVERIAVFTAHFDHLVKEASVGARDLPGHLEALRARVA